MCLRRLRRHHRCHHRQVGPLIEEGLGAPISELFTSLNLTHPVGSASISQVHSGVLRRNGQRVAVKVRRMGCQRTRLHTLSVVIPTMYL
jgi:predicted unusual protein kinase regulating ubiquinone biosynthesis (AarF/ABC1/UbiB family)